MARLSSYRNLAYFIYVAGESESVNDIRLGKLIEDEEVSSGRVPLRVYGAFIMAATWTVVVSTFSLYILGQTLQMTANAHLSKMVNQGLFIKQYSAENNHEVCMVALSKQLYKVMQKLLLFIYYNVQELHHTKVTEHHVPEKVSLFHFRRNFATCLR